jgi:hypothetical protein
MTVGKPDCQDLDFGSYIRASLAVRSGNTPYTVDEHGPLGVYPYAPAYAYLLIPLTYLDYIWACRLWTVFNWLATAGSFWLALRLVFNQEELTKDGHIAVLIVAIPLAGYIWANLRVGQVAMFMVLACLAWQYCQRRGRPLFGGILLAAACALKLAPLLLTPYLFVQRDRRGMAGLGLGTIGLFILPAFWIGLAGSVQMHEEWARHSLATQVPMQTFRPGNQSLLAQLARLPEISNGHRCFSEQNLAELHLYYPLVMIGVAGLFYSWIIWRGRSRPAYPCRRGLPLEDLVPVALLFILLTLLQPRAWRCNFVALLLPCVLVARQICQRRAVCTGLFALALCLLACLIPTDGQDKERWHFYNWLILGKHFWAAISLGVVCLFSSVSWRSANPRFTTVRRRRNVGTALARAGSSE